MSDLDIGGVALRALRTPAPWEAYLLATGAFPCAEALAGKVRMFARQLTATIERESGLSAEMFIQLWPLSTGDAPDRFNAAARQWSPVLGLGVWPNRKPPARWTQETFVDAAAGDDRPISRHRVARITTGKKERDNAREIMLGFGTVLQFMTDLGWEALRAKGREVLLSKIEDPFFRSYRFYVPLLDASLVEGSDSQQLEMWCCGTKVYLRESVEDKGILLLSEVPLEPIIGKMAESVDAAR